MPGIAPLFRGATRWGWVFVIATLVGACGGGSSGNGNPSDTGGNQRPVLSGTAPGVVTANQSYSFKPSASDADGDMLTFAVSNQPAWSRFDPATGELSGTPSLADVGTYTGIGISASDGLARVAIAAFSITVVATGTGTATISWVPPTENTDGTTLTDLAGYRIHYGINASNLDRVIVIDNPGLTSYMIEELGPGKWYFGVTSVTADGTESALSNLASKTIR